jgi:predicted ATPase
MEIKKDVDVLKKMLNNGVFKKHIHYIRYPKFRNLEPDTKISFEFPITFFVGKNGGGKSSTLQSLYGAPFDYSLSDYWFSTAIDPIQELKEDRNCFIYGYSRNSNIVEVLKQRTQRKNKLDYWEPSKPVKKYGMLPTKYSPIKRKVEYIDFRSELSAFDSFMYFMPFNPTSGISSKQDFIRRYSGKIKEAFDTGKVLKHFGTVKNRQVKKLSQQEIDDISYILGKQYETIEILDHKFFKNWGFSVRFTSPYIKYSEAFAGSGETAIIVLINKIHNCTEDTLVLLDEPETSLHFGAQKRLLQYLIKKTKEKRLQIIISTHSPFFLEGMPKESIKVFSSNNVGLFHVENEREAREALIELEINKDSEKIQVLVEDRLGYSILIKVLEKIGGDIKNTFSIKYLPGGADSLKQRMAYNLDYINLPFLILDGDQKKLPNHIDLSEIPPNQTNTFQKLSDLLKSQTGCEIKFFTDGGNSENTQQKIDLINKYFLFYLKNVFYFPKLIPEDIIWCDNLAKRKINDIKGIENYNLGSIKVGDSKNWFLNLSNFIYNDTSNIDALHLDFILSWLNKKDEDFNFICDIINRIRTTNA